MDRGVSVGLCLCCAALGLANASLAHAPPRPEQQQPVDPRRECLPTLLQKALLQNDRKYASALQTYVKLAEAMHQGGELSRPQVIEFELQLLRARVRLLQREHEYNNHLDRLKLHRDLKPEQLQELEKSMLNPLSQALERLEQVLTQADELATSVLKLDAGEIADMRAGLRAIIATAPLFKGTKAQKEIPERWAAWRNLQNLNNNDLRTKAQMERRKLLILKDELALKNESLKEADRLHLAELETDIDLAALEDALSFCESTPRRGNDDAGKKQVARLADVQNLFLRVSELALDERLHQARAIWPTLLPVRMGRVNLLACPIEEAEAVLTSVLKIPEEAAVGRTKLMRLRERLASYSLQQQVVDLCLLKRHYLASEMTGPPAPGEQAKQPLLPNLVAQLASSAGELAGATEELYRTWFDLQLARLDLYQALKLPAP